MRRELQRQYLGEAIEDYLAHRKGLRLSPARVRDEGYILGRLAKVSGPILIGSVGQEHAEAHWADAAQTKTSGLQNDFGVLNLFFKWCRNSKRMAWDANPMVNIEKPPIDERTYLRIPPRDFPRLLDAANHPRDRAAVACALYLLLRVNEIARLRVGDVDLQKQVVRARISKGKRGQIVEREKFISSDLDRELRQWFLYYQDQCGPLNPAWFLVPAKHTPNWELHPETKKFVRTTRSHDLLKPMKPWGGNRHEVAKYVIRKCGYPTRDPVTGKSNYEGMHTFRRSGATALYDYYVDCGLQDAGTLVMNALCHTSITTTLRYIGRQRDEKRLREMIAGKEMYPVDNDNVVRLGSRSRAVGGNQHAGM